jgi:hypothetical protein
LDEPECKQKAETFGRAYHKSISLSSTGAVPSTAQQTLLGLALLVTPVILNASERKEPLPRRKMLCLSFLTVAFSGGPDAGRTAKDLPKHSNLHETSRGDDDFKKDVLLLSPAGAPRATLNATASILQRLETGITFAFGPGTIGRLSHFDYLIS